jgi:hypothetical protein
MSSAVGELLRLVVAHSYPQRITWKRGGAQMPRFDLPQQGAFMQLAGVVATYIDHFEPMWPFYWLKMAAVRDGDTWHLCHFSLAGRWSDVEPNRPVRDPGDALVVVNAPFAAAEVRQMLATLAQDSTLTLVPGVTARAPTIPLSPAGYYWQEPVLFTPSEVADIAEQVPWRYLRIADTQSLPSDFERQARLLRAVTPDLEQRNMRSFEALLASRFSAGRHEMNQYSLDLFRYAFDLPLALAVEHGLLDRKTGGLQLTLRSRRPINPDSIQVTLGAHWSSDAQGHPVDVEVNADSGWSFVTTTVPHDCGGISIWAPVLDKWLPYEIVAPSAAEQARWALHRLYTNAWSERVQAGEVRWLTDLLRVQKGARFEVALVNALTRLGIPVLFGGEIEREGQLGGPATPGVDLIALDLPFRRATVISLKATVHSPSEKEVGQLLEGVNGLSAELPGWKVIGILACRAPGSQLGRFATRTDLRVWSREDLETISAAEEPEAIRHLLWLPPGLPVEASWRYFLGHATPFAH